ncbi:MAG: MFS transporter [Candidatus Margulisiibacteriota bacterium]
MNTPKPINEKLLLLTLAAIQFNHILDFVIMMPLGPQLMRYFAITPHQFGMAVSAYTFSASIFGLIGAFVIDRFDRKKLLLTLSLGFTLGTLLCGFATHFHILLLARILTGAFGGVASSVVLSIIGDVIPEQRRAAATGIVMASFSLASVTGVPLGIYLAARFNWHIPFFCIAGSSLLGFLLGLRSLPSMTSHKDSGLSHPADLFKTIFTLPSARWALALGMMVMFAGFSVIPFISPYMVANLGVKESQLSYMYLAGGLLTFFSSQWVGKLADRFGKPKVFAILSSVALIPILWITHMTSHNLALILFVSSFFFVFVSGRAVPALAMITTAIPPNKRGGFMSINSCLQQLACGLAAYLAGVIIQKAPSGELLQFGHVGAIAALSSLVAMAIGFMIKPFHHYSEPAAPTDSVN